jgi:hypothetical protein
MAFIISIVWLLDAVGVFGEIKFILLATRKTEGRK